MKWLAPYLADAYTKLYRQHKTEQFGFDIARSVINKSIKSITKILNELEDRGFLISKRDEVDKRKRLYRLIPFEKAMSVYGREAGLNDPMEKLKKADMPYLLTGSHASYLYTKYAKPAKIEISVFKKDVESWIAYLKSRDIAIAVDDMPAEGRKIIHIFTDLTKERLQDKAKQDDLSIEQTERLVILLLKRKDSFSLSDVYSLLLTQKISWSKLIKLAKENNLMEELGILLEILNSEAKRNMFGRQLINRIQRQSQKPKKEFHVKPLKEDLFAVKQEIPYQDMGKKWNINVFIPKALITKIIEDLVR